MSAKPRILIDARMFVGRFSGVARVVSRLLREFTRTGVIEPVALLGASGGEDEILDLGIETLRCDFARGDRDPLRRRQWEESRLADWIRSARVDVFHATWNSGVPAACPVPSVLTIHDLIPWHAPIASLPTFLQRRSYRRTIRDAARRADSITTVSEFTRNEVLRTLTLSSQKVRVVPNGVDTPDPASIHEEAAERPFVLYVGGHEPRKNIHHIFATLSAYWQRFTPNLELHLTGDTGALTPDATLAFTRLAHPERVHFLGRPTDKELHSEYLRATALLMLSQAEGFGLPVLEAMVRGCPVIAAPEAALPEVAGDAAACYVDPAHTDRVADAIHRLQADPLARAAVVQAGHERAARFPWSRTAAAMIEVYHLARHPKRRSAHDPITTDPGRSSSIPAAPTISRCTCSGP